MAVVILSTQEKLHPYADQIHKPRLVQSDDRLRAITNEDYSFSLHNCTFHQFQKILCLFLEVVQPSKYLLLLIQILVAFMLINSLVEDELPFF